MCPPRWICASSYTWTHDVRLDIAGELKSAQSAKQGDDTQSAQISQKQDRCNIYAIMKTM